jgi:hypothetical protein
MIQFLPNSITDSGCRGGIDLWIHHASLNSQDVLPLGKEPGWHPMKTRVGGPESRFLRFR